jgi:four helix bundle protein
VDLIDELPNNVKGWVISRQLLRSGTSVGANVREADQALSRVDFIHRLSIAHKEAAETHYWLCLCRDKSLLN